jgi:hypothetical protein
MAQSATKWRVDASRPSVRGCALRASGERVGRLEGRSWHTAGDEACARRGSAAVRSRPTRGPIVAQGSGAWRPRVRGERHACEVGGRRRQNGPGSF